MTTPQPIDLGEFEGDPIRRATIKITKTGDGLSDALAVDPAVYHKGERRYVVLECEVVDVQFPKNADKDGGGTVRKHVFQAGRATIVDAALVTKMLDAQQQRIDAARGIVPLPGMDANDDPDDDEDGGDVIPIGGAV